MNVNHLKVPMNEFRLQCAYECYDGYFSLHPSHDQLIHYKNKPTTGHTANLTNITQDIEESNETEVTSFREDHAEKTDEEFL